MNTKRLESDTVGINEESTVKTEIVDLPKEALEWLERALQWPEDLAAYDRLNKPIKATLHGWIIND